MRSKPKSITLSLADVITDSRGQITSPFSLFGITSGMVIDNIKSILKSAVIFDISNVHQYVEDNDWGKKRVKAGDLAFVRPPYATAFYQWIIRGENCDSNGEKTGGTSIIKEGVLVLSYPITEFIPNMSTFVDKETNFRGDKEKLNIVFFHHFFTLNDFSDVEYICETISIVDELGNPLKAKGQPDRSGKMSWMIEGDPPNREIPTNEEFARLPLKERMNICSLRERNAQMGISVLFAIALSNCKNTNEVFHSPTKSKRKVDKSKSKPLPLLTYRTLNIRPMTKALHEEGKIETEGINRALHLCRGHFKDYREHGLFGKEKGVYWWDAHVRGREENGVVEKDYRVLTE